MPQLTWSTWFLRKWLKLLVARIFSRLPQFCNLIQLNLKENWATKTPANCIYYPVGKKTISAGNFISKIMISSNRSHEYPTFVQKASSSDMTGQWLWLLHMKWPLGALLLQEVRDVPQSWIPLFHEKSSHLSTYLQEKNSWVGYSFDKISQEELTFYQQIVELPYQ